MNPLPVVDLEILARYEAVDVCQTIAEAVDVCQTTAETVVTVERVTLAECGTIDESLFV